MADFKTPFAEKIPTYKSPYGPKYHVRPNVAGITFDQLVKFGLRSSCYGAVGLFTVIYFVSGVPRVQKDIFQKLPFIGDRFVHKIPASDNPF